MAWIFFADRIIRYQRGTNATVKWELSQSVSTTSATYAIMRNFTSVIFTISHGSVIPNTGDSRYEIDKHMSNTITAIEFTIMNVTSEHSDVYTLQDGNKIFGGVKLIITGRLHNQEVGILGDTLGFSPPPIPQQGYMFCIIPKEILHKL